VIDVCTFEGGTQGGLINPENGGLTEGTASRMRFPAPRRTLLGGPFANKPSDPTVAFWTSELSADVSFDVPVGAVAFYYAAYWPVTLEASDSSKNVIATTVGAGNWVYGQGLVAWDVLSVETEENLISSVRVTSYPNATLLDNFTTVIKDPLVEVEMDLKL